MCFSQALTTVTLRGPRIATTRWGGLAHVPRYGTASRKNVDNRLQGRWPNFKHALWDRDPPALDSCLDQSRAMYLHLQMHSGCKAILHPLMIIYKRKIEPPPSLIFRRSRNGSRRTTPCSMHLHSWNPSTLERDWHCILPRHARSKVVRASVQGSRKNLGALARTCAHATPTLQRAITQHPCGSSSQTAAHSRGAPGQGPKCKSSEY